MPDTPESKTELSNKPLNPEMEAVSINQPKPVTANSKAVSQPVSSAPKKIGKEKKEPSKGRFIFGCMGGMIFLFVLFIVLMVLMISRSSTSNSVMAAFGLDPSGVKSFLQGVVGFSFGILSLLFLVLMVIGLFRFLNAQKSDKEKRGSGLRMMMLNMLFLILMVSIWVLLSNFISRIQIAAERIVAEIVVVEPKDISGLIAPVEIRFSALNVAKALESGGVAIESMNWDLDGDGVFETPVGNPEITHLYNKKGTYTIALQVKVAGEDNYRPPYTQVISIPEAAFVASPESGIAPLAVEFDASIIIEKSNVASLDWDFDNDGVYEVQSSDALRVRHTFDQIGTYKVHLRSINKNNNVENYYRTINVLASEKPIVSALFDVSPSLKGDIPFQVRFDAGTSQSLKGNVIKYQWDFGDGSELELGKSVSHVYNTPGFYSVTLHVEDELGNKNDATVQIEAVAMASAPEAKITSLPAQKEGEPLNGTLPFKVEFDGSKSTDPDNDIVQYEWDFNGDGVTDEVGKKVSYIFEEPGTFTVSLMVEDAEAHSDSVSIQVAVQEPGIQAFINATPEEGTVPLTVKFDGSSSSAYKGKIVSYEWDFGDSSPKTITGAIVSHKYIAVGNYQVKLKILTDQNESASASRQIYVREIPLKACFSPSRASGNAPLTVTFDSKCSTGSIAFYSWSFGDDAFSKQASPTHTFENPGTYTVTLEVGDNKNNVNTYQDVIVVQGELK